MVQGYFVQKPTLDVTEIVSSYEHLKYVSQHDKRKNGKIANIEKYLQKSHTVFVDSHINEVYEVLKADKKTHFVPVLARDMTPLGIIKDADIKAYIYSMAKPFCIILHKEALKRLSRIVAELTSMTPSKRS